MQTLRMIILLLLVRVILFDLTAPPDGMDWSEWIAVAVDALFFIVITADLLAGRTRAEVATDEQEPC